MKRQEFSSFTRRLAWARANGACEGMVDAEDGMGNAVRIRCNAPIDHGEFHYDHIIPEWLCQDASLSNCQVLCRQCHKDKTKHDIENIAKSKRVRDKVIKARKPKGRPIPGSKRSGLRKKLDGTVERR